MPIVKVKPWLIVAVYAVDLVLLGVVIERFRVKGRRARLAVVPSTRKAS